MKLIALTIAGQPYQVQEGITVAAALSLSGQDHCRISVSQQPRAPFCSMGVCQECRVIINGVQQLACQTLCQPGMSIESSGSARQAAADRSSRPTRGAGSYDRLRSTCICATAARYLFNWPIPQPRVPLTPARLETLALLAPHPNSLPQGEGAGTVSFSGVEVICDKVNAEEECTK